MECADKALRGLRGTGDALFLGLCHETRGAALVAAHAWHNALQRCEVPFLPEAAASLRAQEQARAAGIKVPKKAAR